jgi:hypothetical protein
MEWVEFKENGFQQNSSEFEFRYPEVTKVYKFSLSVEPKGEKDREETKDEVSIHFQSHNDEKLAVKLSISLLNNVGAGAKDISASKDLVANEIWRVGRIATIKDLVRNRAKLLSEESLKIRCKLTIFHSELLCPNGKLNETKFGPVKVSEELKQVKIRTVL